VSYIASFTGKFITLDGPSGAGKTTTVKRLTQLLKDQGWPAIATNEPSSSPIGELARYGTREYLRHSLSCLIAADRYHHVTNVIQPALARGLELEHLIEDYSIQGFAIVDDNFIVNKNRVSEICDAIADLDLRWSALSRVDTVDAPLLGRMARSGCIEIKYGMESGSERLLKAMRKNTKREQIKRAIHMTNDAGIAAKVFIIHGFPGENTETTLETISLLQDLGASICRATLFRFVPLPGTEVYANAALHGIHGTHLQSDWDGDWSKFHIHHNERRWWGDDSQWAETEASYGVLREFVESGWGDKN
jgi:energy-coupling factor transporter ATP-binding protein EcfA2